MMHSEQVVPVITIDGPSGTGKGTVCQLLAKHLHFHMLDSGSIYRVLAYSARKNNIEVTDGVRLTELASKLNLSFKTDFNESLRIFLDGEDITDEIRSEWCGQHASTIGVIPEVRLALLERQRDFARMPGLVTDGRDMGTVVFPDAVLKIFLTASQNERARRRHLQLKKSGNDVSLAQVVEELAKRDARDTYRTHAPLVPAKDAFIVDTTGLTVAQVFDFVLKLAENCFGKMHKGV